MTIFKHIRVIVNPARGRDQPILHILNTAFEDTGLDWDVVMTKAAGDARCLAQVGQGRRRRGRRLWR